jgi:hypothetical protein
MESPGHRALIVVINGLKVQQEMHVGCGGMRAGDWDKMAQVLWMGTVFCYEIRIPLK